MNALENTLTLPARSAEPRPPRSARVLLALLEKIAHGTLEVRLPDGSQQRFGQPGQHRRDARNRCLVGLRQRAGTGRCRLRRSLDHRRLEQSGPHRPADGAGQQSSGNSRRGLRSMVGPAGSTSAASSERQHARRLSPQHHGALRLGQRLLPPLARSDDELFERPLLDRRAACHGRRTARQVQRILQRSTPALANACWKSAVAGVALPKPRHARPASKSSD
jgi:hypothetical protein